MTPCLKLRGGRAGASSVSFLTDTTWATGWDDDYIETGQRSESSWIPDIPLLRVLGSLLGVLIPRGSASGRRPSPFLLDARLIALLVCSGWPLLLQTFKVHQLSLPVTYLIFVPGLLLLIGTPLPSRSRVWRNHGAEHMVADAYGRSLDILDLSAVAQCSRIHDYCGSNIGALFIPLIPLVARSPLLVALPSAVLALCIATELVWWAAEHRRNVLARVVLAPGRVLQQRVTTIDPDERALALAATALTACLAASIAGGDETDLHPLASA